MDRFLREPSEGQSPPRIANNDHFLRSSVAVGANLVSELVTKHHPWLYTHPIATGLYACLGTGPDFCRYHRRRSMGSAIEPLVACLSPKNRQDQHIRHQAGVQQEDSDWYRITTGVLSLWWRSGRVSGLGRIL